MKKGPLVLFTALLVTTGFSQNAISFKDKTHFAGLRGMALNQGLALADYDGDGKEDLFVSVVQGVPNRLYRNLGNFIFQDVSTVSGLLYTGASRASAWGDIDTDGDPDLYVGNRDQPDIFYINNGDGTFSDQTTEAGISNPGNTTSVVISDVNLDGWLDIYVSNIQSRNQLYINDGNGHFSEQAHDAGVDDLAVGMGAVFFDYDLDGDQDLYQCHDAQIPYILYENRGNGQFSNISEQANVNYPGFGMGVDIGDFNRDGFPDMYITNLYANVLY